jgi:hypothetical protein
MLAAANQRCFSYAAVLQSAEGFFFAYTFLLSQDVHSPQGKIQRDRCGIEFKNCDAYLNRMVFYWVYSSQSMYTGGFIDMMRILLDLIRFFATVAMMMNWFSSCTR